MAREDGRNALPGPETAAQGPVVLSGSIERVIYANEENGYAICDLGTGDNSIVTITGTLPYIGEGDTVTVSGRWIHNPRYGRQFRVERCEKQLPADRAAILRYLSSGTVKGIGPKTAQRIVDEFGEEAFEVIENHAEWLTGIPGVSLKRAKAISEDFRNKAGIRTAMLFFRDFFGPAATVRIYKRWGNRAVELAKENPYLLCEEIEGIGFDRADRMAMQLGLAADSEARLASGVCYLLSVNAAQNGHVCLPRDKAVEAAASLLHVPRERVAEAVELLLRAGRVREAVFSDLHYLYGRTQFREEEYIATKLLLLDKVCPAADTANISAFIAREEHGSGMQYEKLQRQAIALALENGVMLLTGGPGTGKTTVVRALLHIFDSMELRIALTAPTGRAAKRLSEATSYEAKTVHRLLEYGGEEEGRPHFHRDENNLLEEDVVIVDEASMVDNQLMSALLHAVKPGAHLILIGDADQLPSVGAGNVLRDLIDSGRFATVRLTEIFRQARCSLIVTNAHAINRGEMPRLDSRDGDFFFLPRADDASLVATVVQLCAARLPKTYGEMAVTGTQVIAPSRKGEAGTGNLNRVLQAALNPPAPGKKEHLFREQIFREGDRVMQTRNNYDIEWERDDGSTGSGIFNGDIGVIEEVNRRNECLRIRFEDRYVSYAFPMLEELELAYAITVHKSQGSEYPIVVLPLGNVPSMLLSRNLLYTAVTRAQSMVVLVGRTEAVQAMVANHRPSMRYTGLCYRLRERDG